MSLAKNKIRRHPTKNNSDREPQADTNRDFHQLTCIGEGSNNLRVEFTPTNSQPAMCFLKIAIPGHTLQWFCEGIPGGCRLGCAENLGGRMASSWIPIARAGTVFQENDIEKLPFPCSENLISISPSSLSLRSKG